MQVCEVGLVMDCECMHVLIHSHVRGVISSIFFQQGPQTTPQLLFRVCVCVCVCVWGRRRSTKQRRPNFEDADIKH